MPTSGLIITADDYGLNKNVNAGIREGVANGVVTSVHVMANMVGQQEINELIDAIEAGGNNCGIGLHLNTTWGRALVQENAVFKHSYGEVKDEYYYRDLNTYVHGSVIRNSDELKKMQKELKAQFDYVASLIGGAEKLDAISSHYNFHLWDQTYAGFVSQLADDQNVPVRSPYRWKTKDQNPEMKDYQYKKGTTPLLEAAKKVAKKVGLIGSTSRLMRTPLSAKKLGARYKSLKAAGISLPRNSSGHWFGQPSPGAVKWFVGILHEVNQSIDAPGYASEIFMHLSNSRFGGHPQYGYEQRKRRLEYNVITDEDFLADFEEWKNTHDTRHGSYRKVLQGKSIQYTKKEILV